MYYDGFFLVKAKKGNVKAVSSVQFYGSVFKVNNSKITDSLCATRMGYQTPVRHENTSIHPLKAR